MTTTQEGVIRLIKSAITGQPETLPEGMKLSLAAKLMTNQGLSAMCYVGALNCGYPENHPILSFLQDQYCIALINSERQLAQIDRICNALEEKGFDYMPVKGSIIKSMYPDHALRYMCDADILIREEQYGQIQPIMNDLGFQEAGESDHEHIWTHDHLNVELHKRLMPTYNKDYYSYFGEGWDLAKVQTGHRWAMTHEDAFIYDTIHFAKHYRDASANSHFLIDLWIHMQKHPDLDHDYIRAQMAKMRMDGFYENILRVIQAWFENGEWDDVTVRITETLLKEDFEKVQEEKEIAKSARVAQQTGSASNVARTRFLQKAFPSKEQIGWSYPQWKHTPLPVAWVLRWCYLATSRRDLIKAQRETMDQVSAQDIEKYRQDLEYVGLQFSDNVVLPD